MEVPTTSTLFVVVLLISPYIHTMGRRRLVSELIDSMLLHCIATS